MRLFRHWKMILGLMAIFGAGVGTGCIGTVVALHRIFTRPQPQDMWVNARLADMERRLKITPEQKQRLRPIVESADMRIRDIGGESYERLVNVAQKTSEDIARELTPEQREEFDRLRPHVISILRDLTQREITVRSHKAGVPPTPKSKPTGRPEPVSSRQR
ncbi:hypothetical protein DES53_106212 [Roseimicrobium gellanilyticum]|uniref:Spy/CpxP family protein refolding chaperone n=1 Tax=Roseimicrobium gellanilyticum TaxID=748857 RepID=A0A366HL69_9BACT|nr:hypothetical protein [Roseimicrobium gellanilyticum]RBP42503.1 hypothetical protein DES53_106212 [Roseimicrobium gellanilyticum]